MTEPAEQRPARFNPMRLPVAQAYAFWTAATAIAVVFCYYVVDLPLAHAVQPLRGTIVRDIAERLTHLGDFQWYVVPALVAGLIALPFRRDIMGRALYLTTAMLAGGISVQLLKRLFGRARPSRLWSEDIYGFFPFNGSGSYFSFPSGHTTVFFCAWMAFGMIWPRWRALFFVIAFCGAFTRVLVEMHFFGDLLGGALLGTACAHLTARAWPRPVEWAAARETAAS